MSCWFPQVASIVFALHSYLHVVSSYSLIQFRMMREASNMSPTTLNRRNVTRASICPRSQSETWKSRIGNRVPRKWWTEVMSTSRVEWSSIWRCEHSSDSSSVSFDFLETVCMKPIFAQLDLGIFESKLKVERKCGVKMAPLVSLHGNYLSSLTPYLTSFLASREIQPQVILKVCIERRKFLIENLTEKFIESLICFIYCKLKLWEN